MAFLLAAAQRLRLKSQPASGGCWRGDSAGRQGTRQDLPGMGAGPAETKPLPGGDTAPPAACRPRAPRIAFNAHAAPPDAPYPCSGFAPPPWAAQAPRRESDAMPPFRGLGKKRPGRISPPMRCGHAGAWAACGPSPLGPAPRTARRQLLGRSRSLAKRYGSPPVAYPKRFDAVGKPDPCTFAVLNVFRGFSMRRAVGR